MACYLCPELIDEIFEKLPVKSLVRFRSLSKYWYSHIASPNFIRKQSLNATQKVIIQHRCSPPGSHDQSKGIYTLHMEDQLPLDPRLGWIGVKGVEFPIGTTKIIGSCNGILCLRLTFDEKFDICLWNFSIRRKLTLPDHPPSLESVIAECVTFGFGFDPLTDDYKVVMTLFPKTTALVYSMKTDSWSEIAFPDTEFCYLNDACFFNGKFHWVVFGFVNKPLISETCDFILTFDPSSHVFDKILLPKEWSNTQVTIIDDSLAVVSSNGGDTSIWVMKEDYNVAYWYLYHDLKTCSSIYQVRVLQPIRNGDLVFHTIGDRGNRVYNPETGLFSKVSEFRRYCHWVNMVPYVESLELLDKGTPCGETILSSTKKDDHKRKFRLLSHDFDDCYNDGYSDFFDC